MSDEVSKQQLRVLEEIRDQQKRQLTRQEEGLDLQRKHYAIVQEQAERYERIQTRAEQLQDKSSQMISVARKVVFTILPIVIVLLAYLTWLIFR